MTRHLQCGPDS